MCDVHLIETERQRTTWRGLCAFCEGEIHGDCAVVDGTLDNGTPGVQVLRYHPDCLDGIEYEGQDENDGRFSYGRISETLPLRTPSME
jgi:hypothetical protein